MKALLPARKHCRDGAQLLLYCRTPNSSFAQAAVSHEQQFRTNSSFARTCGPSIGFGWVDYAGMNIHYGLQDTTTYQVQR